MKRVTLKPSEGDKSASGTKQIFPSSRLTVDNFQARKEFKANNREEAAGEGSERLPIKNSI